MIKALGLTIALAALGLGWQAEAEKQLEAAMHKAVVEGDLKGAIDRYRKILERHAKNRAVAARALYQMGECQEKLGQAEARKAYERVVKEYGDQTEVAARARAKLGGTGGGQLRARRVEDSPPGCLLQDSNSNTRICAKSDGLYARDVNSGQERKLAPLAAGSEEFGNMALSPDEKTVLYVVRALKRPVELRAVQTDGTGGRVLGEYTTLPRGMAQRGWSRDGKQFLAVQTDAKGETGELVAISVADGRRRTLHRLTGVPQVSASFSPDGRFVAFETRETGWHALANIHILPVDGGDPVPALTPGPDNQLVGWHSDGRLVFTSDQAGGSRDIWAIRIDNGKPRGGAQRLFDGLPSPLLPFLGRGGSIYYSTFGYGSAIYTATLDPASGKLTSAATIATKRFKGGWAPDYSPDGRTLVYASGAGPDRVRFVVQNLAGGEERDYPAPFRTVVMARWYPDSSALLVHAVRQRGEQAALFRFVPATGEVVTVVKDGILVDETCGPMFSRDGRYLLFKSWRDTKTGHVARLDLGSGQVSNVFQQPGYLVKSAVSPDGNRIAFVHYNPSLRGSLGIVPVAGGEAKVLVDFGPERTPGLLGLDWTADGAAILYQRYNKQGGVDVLRVPAGGGEPSTVVSTDPIYNFAIHPNGRDIAWATAPPVTREDWVIENALAPR